MIRCIQAFFIAENARDGYIKNTGTVDAGGARIYVGDYADETFARGFVSFDFASLPSNAVIGSSFMQMWMTKVGTPSQLGDLIAEPVAYGTLGSGDFLACGARPADDSPDWDGALLLATRPDDDRRMEQPRDAGNPIAAAVGSGASRVPLLERAQTRCVPS